MQAACSFQLQRASSCDALLAATAAAAAAAAAGGCEETEEDGAGMELAQLLDRIRAQCHQSRLLGPGERRVGSGLGHATAAAPVAASREHGAAGREVCRHLHGHAVLFFFFFLQSQCPGPPPTRDTHTPSRPAPSQTMFVSSDIFTMMLHDETPFYIKMQPKCSSKIVSCSKIERILLNVISLTALVCPTKVQLLQ